MTTEYPKPSVTVDCVVFRFNASTKYPESYTSSPDRDAQWAEAARHHLERGGESKGAIQVLLIERGGPPHIGKMALPGGFVNMNEALDDAAARELREETGLRAVYLEQLYTFGRPKRDPRGRVISVAYMALLRPDSPKVKGGSDARRAEWEDVSHAMARTLAFDHKEILTKAVERLRSKVHYAPIIFGFLPERFTIPELQLVYETIVGKGVNSKNFRRKLDNLGVLAEVGTKETGRRPATLYRCNLENGRARIAPGDFSL